MRIICFLLALGILAIPALSDAPPSGVVLDPSGAAVAGASIEVTTTGAGSGIGAIIWQGRTAADGTFPLPAARAASLRIRVSAPGFAVHEAALPAAGTAVRQIRLSPRAEHGSVTVTATPATRGSLELSGDSPHVATVKSGAELQQQPLPTIGHALASESGVLLQQSTYAQASPFLRGLTGYQVLNLVDGIRFNNSTFRSGPNQYLAFIDASQALKVEAVLGPAGVSWGSDSLGGTINVVTAQPSFTGDGNPRVFHGQFQAGGASADASADGAGKLSFSTARFHGLAGLSGRLHNDLRAGGGFDSRNVFARLFGLDPSAVRALTGDRQQDTGFRQRGAEARFAVHPRPDQIFSINYQNGAQSGVRGYKDLLGGLGRLVSTFEPQQLHWLYARYEKLGLGPLDSLTGTVSINSQTDGGRRQNLAFTDPVTTDFAKVNVFGYSAQATTHAGSRLLASFGGEIYDEHIASTREVRQPATGTVSRPRPLYPDGSRYQTLGAFAQGSYQATARLRAAAGIRLTGVRFAAADDPAFRIPASSQWFRDVTFQTSLQWHVAGPLAIHGVASRGFRAPNLNDLGALGLNDLGYEIPASEAIGPGALLASDAGEGALATGARLRPLVPESLMNYEFGARLRSSTAYARVQLFDAEMYDPIVRRTLLFPAGSAPSTLAGLPVTVIAPSAAQRQQGVVAVATAFDPRAVKAFVNDGRSRYYGVEAMGHVALTRRLTVEGNYNYILGRDLNPNRNIRRLPPAMASARIRHAWSGRRPWVEFAVNAAAAQSRLSGGDRDDERIGASFRRSDIAAFFRGGRVAPLVDSAGVFRPTGETLLAIQNRVLPPGSTVNGVRVSDDNTRVPFLLSTAGWVTAGLRAGLPLGERWHLNAALENLFDRNYRFHGSGIDAPGRNAWLGVRFVF